jgi:hypothetical protein
MNRSLTRPNAQAVLDLYGYSDRLQIVSALNEDRRQHGLTVVLRRAGAALRRTAGRRPLPATPPLPARSAAVITGTGGSDGRARATC